MQHQNDREEEIDLVKVFGKLKSVLERRRWLFMGFLIGGIAIAVLYHTLSAKVYKSRMIISSTAFQGTSFMVILDNIRLLIEEGNHETLATNMNINLEVAKKIKGIEVYSSRNYAREEFGDKISLKEDKALAMDDRREEFVIEAFVTDNAVLPVLQTGILYYLNENPTIKSSSRMKQEAHEAMKKSILEQRSELDSLKKILAQQITRKNEGDRIYLASPGAIYADIINMINAELKTKEAILASRIEVIEPFHAFKKPSSPRLLLVLLVFSFISMSIFIVTVIYLEGKKK